MVVEEANTQEGNSDRIDTSLTVPALESSVGAANHEFNRVSVHRQIKRDTSTASHKGFSTFLSRIQSRIFVAIFAQYLSVIVTT